ncbi:polysaccharide pyruvyl transferase family protein [Sphingomicrobium sp. XHP0235]|uniref:polysaccharide pyruvyl transferase family protein n=1 Tax=Sphingomicrobium aquimarinum TaxID=3133971 RepID=UPI0031FED79E
MLDFILFVADLGNLSNLGNVAVILAQYDFPRVALPDYRAVPMMIGDTLKDLDSIAAQMRKGDVATLIGGGNMGTRYPNIELLRRAVIDTLHRWPLICFPQSIDLGEDADSESLARFLEPYWKHPRLVLSLRERLSFEKVARLWPHHQRLIHVPDIVLGWPCGEAGGRRSNAVVSWRGDSERTTPDALRQSIQDVLRSKFGAVTERDTETHRQHDGLNEAENALRELLDLYRGARIVATDRLHGLILAYRCGTPVLALDNVNRKISASVDDWLEGTDRVALLDEGESIDERIEALMDGKARTLLMHADPIYDPLRKALEAGAS